MKIIGGSFGTSGSSYVSRDKRLVIEGAIKGIYSSDEVTSIKGEAIKSTQPSAVMFIVVAFTLSLLLSLVIGLFWGGIVGVLAAIVNAFSSEKVDVVTVGFSDGRTVVLECTPRWAKKIFAFAHKK